MEFLEITTQLNPLVSEGLLTYKTNAPLADYASFRIGGNADFIIHPKCQEGLLKLLSILKKESVPFLVFGNASNVLFSELGYRGAVIFTTEMQKCEFLGNCISAEAGTSFTLLAAKAQQKGLSGLEFAYGIPGSVGGAVYMNAGAYGGAVSDCLVSSTYLDLDTMLIHTVEGANEHDFDYRHSRYMSGNCVILSATFALQEADPGSIREKMNEYMNSRKTKQPLEYPSAGSVFKRPREDLSASLLIDKCGLKGYIIGGAQISSKHAGFIVNKGGATAIDYLSLADYAAKEVKRNFDIDLTREIKVM